MDDYTDHETEMEDIRQMALAGLGLDDEGNSGSTGPKLPRRFNMPITTTEYHKIIAARDNMVHPRLRTGTPLQGSYMLVDAIRDTFPGQTMLPSYGRGSQRFLMAWEDTRVRPSKRISDAYCYALDLYSGARAGLSDRGISNPDMPHLSPESRIRWDAWDTLHRAYQRMRGRFARERFPMQVVRRGNIKVLLTPNGSAYSLPNDKAVYFMPISALLMCINSLEIAAKTMAGFDILRPDLPAMTPLYREVLRAQRRLVEKYSDNGYEIAKCVEPLAKTYASDVSGGHHGHGPSSFTKMVTKFVAKELKAGGDGDHVRSIAALVQQCGSVDEATELSGTMAGFGYPVIDVVESGAKAKSSGTSEDQTTPFAVSEIACLFQHLVLKNYVRIHCQYPPMRFSRPGTRLERFYKARYLDVVDGSYPLSDWYTAEMHDLFSFMYHEDYLQLIADKATLEPKALAKDFYNGTLSDVTIKRLITKVLNTESIDTKADVDAFAAEVWPEEWRRCRLVPKEQEHKAQARMFVVLPDMIRRALSIIQENVKELFFPLIPYTSMAMTGQELSQALHEATRGSKKYKLELDLASWNLRFRERLTRPIGYLMDKMSGVTNLFGGSHRFFSRAEFCVSHRDTRNDSLESLRYPYETEESDMLWCNDDSGKEGIEQRFWTVITELIVYRCLWRHGLPFRLLGQGDNQTLVIDMSSVPDGQIGSLASEIELDIEQGCAECNHECKPEEFLGSMTVLTYSKNFFVNGRQIAQAVKPAARITHGSSDSLETLEDDVGGISSSAYTAAANAPFPLLVWALGAMHMHTYLSGIASGDNQYSALEQIEAAKFIETRLTWLVPPVIGGLPVVPLGAFLYRGDPDPLSHALASLRCLSALPEVACYLEYIMSDEPYASRSDVTQLALNPYGLPLLASRTGAAIMQDFSHSYLTAVRNRDVQQLAVESQSSKAELIAAVSSIRPFIPGMVSDILDASLLGRAEKVAKKFTAANTILRMAPYEIQVQAFYASYVRAANVNLRFVVARTYVGAVPSPDVSSYHLAERLRLRWGLGPGGIIGASVAQPLDYVVRHDIGPGVICAVRDDASLDETGPCSPYLGSKTMERRAAEKYEVVRTPGTADMGKMVLSATAGTITEDVRQIYESVCASRCDIPFEQLCNIFPRTISGTPGHRYESLHGTRVIAPVGNPAPRTWMELNTDDIPDVSGGATDYPIPVQSFMAMLISVASTDVQRDAHRRLYRIALVGSEYPELPNPARVATVAAPRMPPLPMNRLAHIPSISILRVAPRIGVGAAIPVQRAGLLTGLLILLLTGRRTGNMAAETGDARAASGVDIAAATAAGSEMILSCATRACVVATCWHMTWFTTSDRWTHAEGPLIDNLSASLAKHLYAAITHPLTDQRYAHEMGIGRENPGSSGMQNAIRYLQRAISGRAIPMLSTARGIQSAWNGVQFPEICRNAPPVFLPRLELGTMVWATHKGGASVHVRALQRLVKQVWKEVDTANPLASDVAIAGGIRVIATAALQRAGELSRDDIRIRSPSIIKGDDTGAWRLLRAFARTAPRFDPPERVCSRILVTPQPCPVELSDTRQSVPPPPRGRLPEAPRADPASRVYRVSGLRSSAPSVFGHHLERLQAPVLVVGTGSGGVQRALASMGTRSDGLDLASTIPAGRTASLGWVPGDIKGVQGAGLSRTMWETNGDWFSHGARAVSNARYRAIVIDIQSGPVRYGVDLLDPLGEACWRGEVVMRVYWTIPECERAVAWMAARSFQPVVYSGEALSRDTMLSREHVMPWIITLYYQTGSTPTMYKPAVVVRAPCTYAPPADPFSTARALMLDLSGGLMSTIGLVDTYEEALRRSWAAGATRTSTAHGQALQCCRVAACLRPFANYVLSLDGVKAALRSPPAGLACGGIIVHPTDRHYIYMWEKIMPRLIGALILCGTHETEGLLPPEQILRDEMKAA